MKSLFTVLLLLSISLSSHAQKEVPLGEVSRHIGDSVIVGGKVFSSQAANGGKLLLVNLGGAFPNQQLTVVLGEEIQKALEGPLKSTLEQMKVAGKVELYRDKPQIVIKHPAQIQSIITEKPAQ